MCVVIGGSAGSTEVLREIYQHLTKSFPWAVVICQHVHATTNRSFRVTLGFGTSHKIKEAEEKEKIQPGITYLAPANYHLLIERDQTFSLNIDDQVCYSRPSINVLFETAAIAFGNKLIGILLTGANEDGACGLKSIKDAGGITVIQDPKSAAYPEMPEAALRLLVPNFLLTPIKIAELLNTQYHGEKFAN